MQTLAATEFGSAWLVIYFLICSCTFICSVPRWRDEIIRRFILLPLQGAGGLTVEVNRTGEGAPQAVVAWGFSEFPKGS